ncbi:MAG: hypothetical protein WC634_01935 [archaeon]
MKIKMWVVEDFQADPFTLTWYNRALRTTPPSQIDDGDRFMSLWVCFNSIIRKKYGEKLYDGVLIDSAKTDNEFEEIFSGLFKTEPFQSDFFQLKKMPVRNMRNVKNLRAVREEEVRVISEDKFSELIKVIYDIRNNLFHGRKNPEDIYDVENNDYTLIKLAYKLLLPIVTKYLENKGLIKPEE